MKKIWSIIIFQKRKLKGKKGRGTNYNEWEGKPGNNSPQAPYRTKGYSKKR